jgi:hypothetical protein
MAPHASHARATAAVGASLLVFAAVAAGCGGSGATAAAAGPGTAPAAPAAASPTATPAPYSQAELQQRALAVSDLPPGYQVTSDSSSSSSGSNPTVTSSDPACQPLADLSSSGKPAQSFASAQAPQFAASPEGPFIDESLASYATPAAAQAFLDKITKAIQSCKQFTETQPDGTKLDITVSPFSFPQKGDASSASRLGFSVQGQPVVADAVVSRIGSTLIAVINTALQNTDSTLTSKVVDAAVAKVRNPAAAGGAAGSSGASATSAAARF